jgi:hypothetical protein
MNYPSLDCWDLVKHILCYLKATKLDMVCVAPDIATTFKNSIFFNKEQIYSILFFDEKMSYLKSCHIVLWSLGTLIDQQRFYGTRLVTKKISSPLKRLTRLHY